MSTSIKVSENYLETLDKIIAPFKNSEILFLYGENSIKSYDVYSDISSVISRYSLNVTEFGGIHPNPIYEDILEGVSAEINPKLILSIGGGSVLDTAKFLKHNYFNRAEIVSLFTIMGSDSYRSNLSYFRSTTEQIKVINCMCKPNHILISPKVTTSVPPNYTAYSSIAIFTKAIFGLINNTDVTVENINEIITLIEEILINPFDPDKREALINWDIKLNKLPLNLVSILGNVITKQFNIPLGAAISIVAPAYLKEKKLFDRLYNNKKFLFYNFSRFSEVPDNQRLEWWLHSLGSPIKFSEYNIEEDSYKSIIEVTLKLCKELGLTSISKAQIMNLLKLAT